MDIEIKASLQLPSGITKIDFKCFKSYRLSVKKNKDKIIQEYWDRDKDKAKFYSLFLINSQP